MRVTIRDASGDYVIPDVDGVDRHTDVTKLTVGRDILFVATKDIVEVDVK